MDDNHLESDRLSFESRILYVKNQTFMDHCAAFYHYWNDETDKTEFVNWLKPHGVTRYVSGVSGITLLFDTIENKSQFILTYI